MIDEKFTVGSIAFMPTIIGYPDLTKIQANTATIVRPVAMVPTLRLRWSKEGKLQQMWHDYNCPDTQEWRDILTEE